MFFIYTKLIFHIIIRIEWDDKMNRIIKNILMILLILVLIFLAYFTLGYLKEEKSLVTEFKTNIIILNEENNTSTEIIDENGNFTTTVYEENIDGTREVAEDPDAVVSSGEEILYEATEEELLDNNISTTTIADNAGAEKSLALNKLNVFQIPIIYLIAFSTESLLAAFTLAYLAYSKFNKLNLKETFYSKSRLILYILYSLVLAANFLLAINYYIKSIN